MTCTYLADGPNILLADANAAVLNLKQNTQLIFLMKICQVLFKIIHRDIERLIIASFQPLFDQKINVDWVSFQGQDFICGNQILYVRGIRLHSFQLVPVLPFCRIDRVLKKLPQEHEPVCIQVRSLKQAECLALGNQKFGAYQITGNFLPFQTDFLKRKCRKTALEIIWGYFSPMVVTVLQKPLKPVKIPAKQPQLICAGTVRLNTDDFGADPKRPDCPVLLIMDFGAVGKGLSCHLLHKRIEPVVIDIQNVTQHKHDGDKTGMVLVIGVTVITLQQRAGNIFKC